ncbi:MAG: RNA degradosome polyphosphate kinase, partial [Thermaurantiacus sp.]
MATRTAAPQRTAPDFSNVPVALASDRLLNRELSWLQFNARVLEEAMNPSHPLLERLRFLSISGNNLDEFAMVRVAGLRGQLDENVETLSAEGFTPAQQLVAISEAANRLLEEQQAVYAALARQLRGADVFVLAAEELSGSEAEWLETHFRKQIFPVLTPQAIDPAHPFPFIPNLGFTVALALQRASDGRAMRALIRVPAKIDRFI